MKKLISLLLCMVMCCLVLVSCDSGEIGADLDDYKNEYSPENRESLTLNFYIITGDDTHSNAISTVSRMINLRLSDLHKTTLNINYVTEDQYVERALAASKSTGDDRADILLVAGYEMFNTLMQDKSLVSLNSFLNSTAFGKLDTDKMITSTILEASSVIEEVNGEMIPVHYVIPNNHVVGSYEYIMINQNIAQIGLGYSTEKILSMTSLDSEYLVQLQADLVTHRDTLVGKGYDPDKCIVHIPAADYATRDEYIDAGYVCNVASVPVVDAEEAHKSSFAIVKKADDDGSGKYADYYSRCMEVIYSINADVELRNLLQYGVENTNYYAEKDENGKIISVAPVDKAEYPQSVYEMNLLYTGPVFNAYYSDVYGWNENAASAGKLQNADSILPTAVEE